MGLIGAYLCGPRLGRFEDGLPKDILGHDMVFVTVGAFVLARPIDAAKNQDLNLKIRHPFKHLLLQYSGMGWLHSFPR